MHTINIKYFEEGLTPVELRDNGDWVDLRASKDISIKKNEFALIPLGVGMKLPEGYEAHMVPRSSTYKNYKIIQTNHQGVIDESYCGNDDQWYFPAYALEDTLIRKNERICQFRIMKKQPKITFNIVDELTGLNRGGFGSSGKV